MVFFFTTYSVKWCKFNPASTCPLSSYFHALIHNQRTSVCLCVPAVPRNLRASPKQTSFYSSLLSSNALRLENVHTKGVQWSDQWQSLVYCQILSRKWWPSSDLHSYKPKHQNICWHINRNPQHSLRRGILSGKDLASDGVFSWHKLPQMSRLITGKIPPQGDWMKRIRTETPKLNFWNWTPKYLYFLSILITTMALNRTQQQPKPMNFVQEVLNWNQ